MRKCRDIKCPLPTDIIINDILPRVPAEVLHSWRFACKQWFQLVSNEPTFIEAQLVKSKRKFIFDINVEYYYHKQVEVDIVFNEITKTVTSFTCSRIFPNKFDWVKDRNGSKIAIDISVEVNNSCNGLILLQHMEIHKLLYIANPTTKQLVSLPRCNLTICCAGLGYDPFSKKYKVVCFFRDLDIQMNMMQYGCDVLTLGTDTWRPIELPFEYFYSMERPISVGTYLHFRYKHWRLESRFNTITSMDIVNETCQLTSPPDAISGLFDLLTIGESLALAPCDYSVCDHIDIWILEDCVKGLWSKKYSIAKDLYYGCGRNLRSRLPDRLRPIATLDNGKVVIFQEFNELRLFYFVVGCNKFVEIQSPWKKLHTGDSQYPTVIKVFDHISTLALPYAQ